MLAAASNSLVILCPVFLRVERALGLSDEGEFLLPLHDNSPVKIISANGLIFPEPHIGLRILEPLGREVRFLLANAGAIRGGKG